MLRQKMRAFTLVELMLVVAIITIISAVSWESMGGMNKKVVAGDACTQLAALINKTRNYAVSGRVKSVTIKIEGSKVSVIAEAESIKESYVLKGGVDCGNGIFTYSAPSGSGGATAEITCKANGIEKKIKVTPYQAVCQ